MKAVVLIVAVLAVAACGTAPAHKTVPVAEATGHAGTVSIVSRVTTTQPFSLRVTTASRASLRSAAMAASKSTV